MSVSVTIGNNTCYRDSINMQVDASCDPLFSIIALPVTVDGSKHCNTTFNGSYSFYIIAVMENYIFSCYASPTSLNHPTTC